MRLFRLANVSFNIQSHQTATLCGVLISLVFIFSSLYPKSIEVYKTYTHRKNQQCEARFSVQLSRSWEKQKQENQITADNDKAEIECPILHLGNRSKFDLDPRGQRSSCQRSRPEPGSCQIAQELFFSLATPRCPTGVTAEFCFVKVRRVFQLLFTIKPQSGLFYNRFYYSAIIVAENKLNIRAGSGITTNNFFPHTNPMLNPIYL